MIAAQTMMQLCEAKETERKIAKLEAEKERGDLNRRVNACLDELIPIMNTILFPLRLARAKKVNLALSMNYEKEECELLAARLRVLGYRCVVVQGQLDTRCNLRVDLPGSGDEPETTL